MDDKGPARYIARHIFVSRNARLSAIARADNGCALPPRHFRRFTVTFLLRVWRTYYVLRGIR